LPMLVVGRSGWVAKVVQEGVVKAGDPAELINERSSDQAPG
jgi:MOSC domain-containing protein YiiM